MSGTTTSETITGSSGGTINDQPGAVVIALDGANPTTVVAGLGTDTVLGSDGPLYVNAYTDPNPITVQPGFGAATITGGGGDVTIAGTDGSEYVTFTALPGHTYQTTTDLLTLVTIVSDGTGTDTVMGGALVHQRASPLSAGLM